MTCPKREFQTKMAAEEALIQSHIIFTSPAINYYQCDNCGQFHLTSKGNTNPILEKDVIKERIKREQQARQWENKY